MLVVQSDQSTMEQISTLRWDGEEAQSRMDDLLSSYYSDEELDAVLSPYDGISIGIISSLQGAGYGGDDLPVVTGQDAEVASVRSIIDGEQAQTVFKDTRDLAEVAVNMTVAVLEDEEPEVNDTESYDNDVKVVPSYLLEPVSVDADNYEAELIEVGYYDEDDLS
jgi:putative multiple sugar transport system substrate-binding protein